MKRMKRENLMVHLARALTGMTQKEFARHTGIHPVLLSRYESGAVVPHQNFQRALAGADLTLEEAEELLRHWETRRARRLRQGRGAEDLLTMIGDTSRSHARRAFQRLLRVSGPPSAPKAEDRTVVPEQLAALRAIPPEHRVSAAKVSRDLQNWALCEAAVLESVEFASRDLKEARVWAQVAVEIAERVKGPEGWCKRVRGYAGGATANILRVTGDHRAAEVELEAAKRLWLAGSDPDQLLDPGWLLDVEGALRRDQRRFDEALSCFDQSRPLSRPAARPLIMKGFTYEVMGEYESAIATLLEAERLLDRQSDPRPWYKQRANLAVLYTHVGRYHEAVDLVAETRQVAIELGDEIDLVRLTWLDGRIAAGLGHRAEALGLLAQAREEFEAWEMWYDVALALIEEAALLLDESRTTEVKALTRELVKVFQSKRIHREALAALRLFQEAVEQDRATFEQARDLLRFLFRARHDQGLRFES
jgi:tetratricopeptide (TPR) repeat protein